MSTDRFSQRETSPRLLKENSIELNPDEKLTLQGISGKIAKVGVGFGTGRHSEQRSALKGRTQRSEI